MPPLRLTGAFMASKPDTTSLRAQRDNLRQTKKDHRYPVPSNPFILLRTLPAGMSASAPRNLCLLRHCISEADQTSLHFRRHPGW